jgi:hypothetical protein
MEDKYDESEISASICQLWLSGDLDALKITVPVSRFFKHFSGPRLNGPASSGKTEVVKGRGGGGSKFSNTKQCEHDMRLETHPAVDSVEVKAKNDVNQ